MKKTTTNVNYSKSINNLFVEIKSILVEKIKQKNSNYTYVTLSDLKNNAILYLPTEAQSCAIAFYQLVMQPKDEKYEYQMLLNIYENLK